MSKLNLPSLGVLSYTTYAIFAIGALGFAGVMAWTLTNTTGSPGTLQPPETVVTGAPDKLGCALPWGANIRHGESVKGYLIPTVSEQDACEPNQRTAVCEAGRLSQPIVSDTCVTQDTYSKYVTFQLGFDNLRVQDVSAYPANLGMAGNIRVQSVAPFPNTSGLSILDAASGIYVPAATKLAHGDRDFTIEFWVRPAVRGRALPVILSNAQTTADTPYWALYDRPNALGAESKFALYHSKKSTLYPILISNKSVDPGQWTHVVLQRKAAKLHFMINGENDASVAFEGPFDGGTAEALLIGGQDPFFGDITQLRITDGIVRYLGNFSLPAKPLADASKLPIAPVQVTPPGPRLEGI